MKLWIQMGTFAAGVLLLAIADSYFLIRRITRPLSALAEAAENLDQGSLDFRAEPTHRDEVGRLTIAINRMVQRIGGYTQRLEKNTS